ncbi:Wzz/FepE/Etk N-terminal domain-containing protein [Paenibacillus sp. BR2-3]|uniref:YveK family protein n=1 Tax=Paenibacillus sp. BR2-3 TaxID=3048494 RepID=UPI00397778A0
MKEEVTAIGRSASWKSPVKEIDLKEIYTVIKRRIWIIVLSTVLLATLGGIYSSIPEAPVYGSSARVMLSVENAEMLGTLKVFIKEPVVLERVIKQLGLQQSVGNLREHISVSSVDNSIITLITAFDEDPKRAVDIANLVVAAFTEEAGTRLQFNGVSVLTNAVESPNPTPVNPPSKRALIIGIVAGVAVGVCLAFLLDSLDDSVRSERDLERYLGIKPLGQVSKIQKKDLFTKVKRKNEYIRGETIGS